MEEEKVEEENLETTDEEDLEEPIEPEPDNIPEPEPEPEPEEGPEVEEPCDPTRMNCDELGHHIIGLVDKRSEYTNTINKLDEVKKIIPSDTIDKIYDDTIKEKKAIDDEIYLVAERAIACRTLTPEEKKE